MLLFSIDGMKFYFLRLLSTLKEKLVKERSSLEGDDCLEKPDGGV